MATVPLPVGFTALDDFPRLRENLINCFNPDAKVIPTPGLRLSASGFGKARGEAIFLDEAYQVSGSRFIRINQDGSVDNLGSIIGVGKVVMAPSFAEMAIVNAQTGDGFVWDGTTLTQITDISYRSSVDVTTIDGRAVFTPTDGGPLLYTLANDFLTIDGFIDAEVLPDRNIASIRYRGDLYALGENSIELLRSTADPQIPFQRSSGAAIQAGYVAGQVKWNETFAFLGRVTDNSYSFHYMDNGVAPRISSPEIEELLQSYTLEELETCVGQTYKWKGYQILQFTIESIEVDSISRTFSFLNGRWFFVETGIGGPDVQGLWRGRYITFAYGKYLIGDTVGGNIGEFSDDNLEYGQNIEREIQTYIRDSRGAYFFLPSLTVNCLVGVATVDATIGLTVSKDGMIYNTANQIWRDLGRVGDYSRRIKFRGPGGLGNYENFCGIRLRVTEQVEFAADALQAG